MATPRQVRISDRAARDLAHIWQSYRMSGTTEQALTMLRSLGAAIKNVPFTPLGSPLDPASGARERFVDGCTIIYDVEPGDGIGPCAGHVNVLTISGPHARPISRGSNAATKKGRHPVG